MTRVRRSPQGGWDPLARRRGRTLAIRENNSLRRRVVPTANPVRWFILRVNERGDLPLEERKPCAEPLLPGETRFGGDEKEIVPRRRGSFPRAAERFWLGRTMGTARPANVVSAGNSPERRSAAPCLDLALPNSLACAGQPIDHFNRRGNGRLHLWPLFLRRRSRKG